ncbi:MAG: hypothetical protein RJA36_1976 [Pseudomonadota bacterium]|jgi:hypothetical protein
MMRMNLNPHRSWITPAVIGAFALSAATGVLMFFHLDSGLNKAAHEWLSWALLGAVGLHALLHVAPFKRHLGSAVGRGVVLGFLALLALSFVPAVGKKEHPFSGSVKALARLPLPTLAQVAGVSTDELQLRLRQQGLEVADARQSLQELVGADTRAQARVLNRLLAASR